MTREEFIENIRSWNDLLQFCYDYDCDYCEDVYDEDAKDDYFNNDIVEMARNADSWQDLYRQLEDIPTGYDYYINDDYDWRGADDRDFDNYKSDVLSWGDDYDVWDEEDEDDEDVLEEEYVVAEEMEDDKDDEELEEGCSLGELFTSSATKLQTIEIEAEKEREREEKFFEQFLASAT